MFAYIRVGEQGRNSRFTGTRQTKFARLCVCMRLMVGWVLFLAVRRRYFSFRMVFIRPNNKLLSKAEKI